MNRLLLSVALPCLAAAQGLQLTVLETAGERPAPAVYDMGTVAATDHRDVVFRIRNTTAAAVRLDALWVRGTGFTMRGDPPLPHPVPAWSNTDFTIRFAPPNAGSYSATLTVNSTNILLRGSAPGTLVLSLPDGVPIAAGSTIDFGRVERPASAVRRLRLSNPAAGTLVLASLATAAGAFRLAEPPPLPTDVAPGASLEFDIVFEPRASGIATSTLSMNGRTFTLSGSAFEPPFPRPSLIVDLPVAASARQGRASIRFASPSRATGRGKLTMRFDAATPDDAAMFTSNSKREVEFTVGEGQSEVAPFTFQTGTTAGTMELIVEIGGFTDRAAIVIPPAAIALDSARVSRSGSELEIRVTGFDNSRTAGQVVFTFYDDQARPVQPGAIRVDAAAKFRDYFSGSRLGGIFSFRAVFPVTGNAAAIRAAEVELVNASGSTRTERLQF